MSENENTRTPNNEINLDQICNAQSLQKLNQLLTQAMAGKKIQALIKGDNLNVVTKAIVDLAQNHDDQHKLLAAAILSKLAKIARGRRSDVVKQISLLITKEPPSLNVLADEEQTDTNENLNLGKIKYYASQSLRDIDADWLPNYCLREAVNIETPEKARRELLNIALEKHGNAADWIKAIAAQSNMFKSIKTSQSRLKRVRHLFLAILEQLQQWQGKSGDEPGQALEKLFVNFVPDKPHDVEKELLFDILNCSVEMLLRLIQLRFSVALYAKTYALIRNSKRAVGGQWSQFLQDSSKIQNLRIYLLETALVLARQRQTDKEIIAVMTLVYTSRVQLCNAIKRHFESAQDLEAEFYDWWSNAGEPSSSRREVEHEMDNTEDKQIGSLLIEVETSTESIEKLENTVVPLLKISDPVLASTIEKIARSYTQMVQTVHRLAKMRRLDKTDSKSMVLEYNQSEHEMLGGHQSGVRTVKVIRNGITKEFGGRKKILVKAWVEPTD